MVDPVSITPQQQDVEPVDLGTDEDKTLPPSADVAQTRSQKAAIGLAQPMQTDYNGIYGQIATGKEQDFRNSAASTLNFNAAMTKEQAVMDAYRSKGSPLTYDDVTRVLDPFTASNAQANPVDVIERAYATNYVSSLNTADAYMRDTVLTDAANEIPEQLKDKRDTATGLVGKIELAKTLREDVENEVQNQSWVGWGADQLKQMLQPYNEYKLRGLNPEVGKITGGLLLGDNMRAQADDLLMSPSDVFAKRLPEIISSLRKDNPSLASQFLDYVIGSSSDSRLLNNIFTIMAPLDAATVAKGGVSLLRKVAVNNRAGTAFKQMVQEAAKPDALDIPVLAKMQEAAGDIQGSAATRAADHIDKMVNGNLNPIQDIKESITSNFRLDGDLVDSQPGKFGREALTEMKDSFYESGNKLANVLGTVLKVNRTPVSLTNPDALRAYQMAERARYPGLDNALLDISSPIQDKTTGTYWLSHTFGNFDGRLFSDPETATAFAKDHGFADPRIAPEVGTVEKQAAKPVMTAKDFNRKNFLDQLIPQATTSLERSKNFLSKKFIGPRSPEALQKAQEDVTNLGKIIPGYQKELDDIKSRVQWKDPIIEQNGVGYKFSVMRPYRETDDVVRQWLINDSKAKSTASLNNWDSWKNSWLGWVRGSDDTLAYNESVQRKVANYTQSTLRVWAKEEAKAIEDIAHRASWYKPQTWYKTIGNKQMFEEFNQTLKFAKSARDGDGNLGYFFRTPGELQDHYMRFYGRDVTLPEVKAYFAHTKLLEGNRVLSEIAEFRNRARLGTEQHQIYWLGKDGIRQGSGYFDGIEQRNWPGGSDQILITGGHQGDERLYNLGRMSPNDVAKHKKAIEQGNGRLIRIYDPDSHPLENFSNVAGDNRVRYIFTTDSDSKPLGLNHVNRRGGGHFDVDSDWYVKQANMVQETAGEALSDKRKLIKSTYTGDNTFMPVGNRVLGRDIAGKMTKMNELMRGNRIDEAKALSRSLGIDWDKMEGFYKPKTAPNGHVFGKPSIDMNEPFYLVPRNKRILDLNKDLEQRHGDIFQDAARSGSDAQQFQVAYNQARDSENLMTIKNEGTHANPIYKYVPADYVDPIPSLNRALNRAISSTFMDDYKIHAVEHWLQEAIPHLKASESEVRSAPFYHFNNADRGAFKSATETDQPGVIDNLLSNRFKIRMFTGMPNKVDTYIHGMTQLLVDEMYKRGTPEWFQAIPLWALSRATNPSALRSFAFNAKLGIFSIPQFLVQAQTFANIWAISPRAGAAGTMATMLHTWSRINSNPEMLRAMDNMASKMNFFGTQFKPGWWMEARQELAKTGYEHVGGEYMLSDDQMQHNFFRNQWGNFLDSGQIFFKEGEKAARTGSYYTSYLEWRSENPTKALDDTARASILQRADLLNNNMSRASASSLNSSLLSLPTQFLSYQIRLGELFLGKRLGGTTAERVAARARMLGFFAALYGAPSAIGVTGYPDGGVPMIPSIREYAINHGYQVGDNQIEDLVMNGLPAWSLAMISGGGDYGKGSQYNVGNRYGSQGLTVLNESMRSDGTIWKLATGASGSVIGNTILSLDPFWQAAKHLVSDDEEGNTFKLTPDHFLSLFGEISSVDSAKRFIYAMHTGRWIGHNEQYIEDVSGKDALFRTLTGLRSQEQDDIWSLHNIKDAEENAQKSATKEIVKDYQRGIQATVDKDDASALTYFTNARARMVAAGIPWDMRTDILSNASRGWEPQIETSVRNWAQKHVPAGQEDTRTDAYTRFLQRQEYRNK